MIRSNGRKRNNFFRRGVYSCSGCKGQGDDSLEMEDSGWREHLSGSSQSEWLHHGVSAEDDRETRREGGGSKLERSSGAISFNGTFFKSGFFWVRQAGEDQSERQAFGARGNQGEGSLGWQVFLFCNLVGGSAKG